jgi:tetratricopeptide (TPR) repeat protein
MPKTSEQAARRAVAGAVWLSFVVAVGVGSWLPIAGCGKDGQADKERGASTQPASASATAAGAREKDQSDPVGAAKLHAAGVVMFATALVEKDAAGRDKALAMMERAVVADEAQAAYKIDLADAYVQLDREILIPAALDLYEEVLAAEPKNEAVLGRIAQAYGRLGNPAAAFAFAKKRLAAAESESGVNMAASQVGFLALEAEQWAAGLDLLASARERFPGNQALLLLTAALQQGAGQQAEAMANVQRVIDSGQANERVLAQAKAMKERMGGQ